MTNSRHPSFDDPHPHQDQQLHTAGAPRGAAQAAVVLLHGRGAKATGMLQTAQEFYRHGVMLLAPQAARYSWFPNRASAPIETNEPWLTSAVDAVQTAIDAASDAGVPPEQTIVFGFSQGAAVIGEFAIRHPRRYGGLIMAAGAIPGLPERNPVVHSSLDDTPVTLAASEDDPNLDVAAIHRTAAVLERGDARVRKALTGGSGHAITDGAINAVDSLLDELLD